MSSSSRRGNWDKMVGSVHSEITRTTETVINFLHEMDFVESMMIGFIEPAVKDCPKKVCIVDDLNGERLVKLQIFWGKGFQYLLVKLNVTKAEKIPELKERLCDFGMIVS